MADLSRDTLLFMAEMNRMCESYDTCPHCPMDDFQYCHESVKNKPNERKQILDVVQRWHDENPRKTYAQDFLKKFPNALKKETGFPWACRHCIYGNVRSCTDKDCCDECWNKPMEYNL